MSAEERDSRLEGEEQILCADHEIPLELGEIELTYQGHTFSVEMLRCPICGEVLIPEELVKGKILDVEHTLEEK